jgi:hypothetical protein
MRRRWRRRRQNRRQSRRLTTFTLTSIDPTRRRRVVRADSTPPLKTDLAKSTPKFRPKIRPKPPKTSGRTATGKLQPIRLHHPLDGVTNPVNKLLRFIKITIFCKEKKALAFNWYRCCHLALCLWLILFHYLCWWLAQWIMVKRHSFYLQ